MGFPAHKVGILVLLCAVREREEGGGVRLGNAGLQPKRHSWKVESIGRCRNLPGVCEQGKSELTLTLVMLPTAAGAFLRLESRAPEGFSWQSVTKSQGWRTRGSVSTRLEARGRLPLGNPSTRVLLVHMGSHLVVPFVSKVEIRREGVEQALTMCPSLSTHSRLWAPPP